MLRSELKKSVEQYYISSCNNVNKETKYNFILFLNIINDGAILTVGGKEFHNYGPEYAKDC